MSERESLLVGRPLTALDVEALPRRTAHAVHALLAVRDDPNLGPYGPFTAAEVCLYDSSDAVSPRHTAAALREASKLGLAFFIPPNLWTAGRAAMDLRAEFEDRFLRDTGDERDA